MNKTGNSTLLENAGNENVIKDLSDRVKSKHQNPMRSKSTVMMPKQPGIFPEKSLRQGNFSPALRESEISKKILKFFKPATKIIPSKFMQNNHLV